MNHAIRSRRAPRIDNRFLVSHAIAFSLLVFALAALLTATWGCTPKVTVEAPKEPIEINLNIKIEHEIRVKVDNDLEQLFEDDDELF